MDNLQNKLRLFAEERDWDNYHTPKNLVMALSGEIGELTEIFQWLNEDESKIENLSIKNTFEQVGFLYKPIPYKPNIKLLGHFQSWKYFDHNRKYIQDLFSPKTKIDIVVDQSTYQPTLLPEIKFNKQIRAIAPGQSAVLYKDNICLGGGIIEETF